MRRGLIGLALLSFASGPQAYAQGAIVSESLAPPAGVSTSTRPLSLQPGTVPKLPSMPSRMAAPAITAPSIAPPNLPSATTAGPISAPAIAAPAFAAPARPALPQSASLPQATPTMPAPANPATGSALGRSSPGQSASSSGASQIAALPSAPGPARPIIATPREVAAGNPAASKLVAGKPYATTSKKPVAVKANVKPSKPTGTKATSAGNTAKPATRVTVSSAKLKPQHGKSAPG